MRGRMLKIANCLSLITYGFTNPMPDAKEGPWKVTAKDILGGRIDYDSARHTTIEAYTTLLTDKSRPQKGDVLLTKDGTLGRLAIADGNKICINQSVALLRTKTNVLLPEYLYYVLSTPEYQNKMIADAGGSTIKHIYITRVDKLEIPVPDLEEQKRYVDVIKQYDDLIENNKKQIKLLEEAAQRLYREWFLHLQYPGYENVEIIDGLPEGWSNVKVTDLLEIKYGKDHKELEDGNIPVYGSGGIMRKVQPVLYSGESVLIPRKGSLNNILFVEGDFWTIDTMFYSIPRLENVAKYVYLYLRGLDMYSFNIGAAVPSMTTKILSGMDIVLPSKQILQQFEEQLSPMFARMKCLEMQCETASEARDRLLPKLMSGDIEL